MLARPTMLQRGFDGNRAGIYTEIWGIRCLI